MPSVTEMIKVIKKEGEEKTQEVTREANLRAVGQEIYLERKLLWFE